METNGEAGRVKSYRDLIVWQKAMARQVVFGSRRERVSRIEKLASDRWPSCCYASLHERFGLVSQMRRAAVSIPSNVAEGHGRLSTNEYRQFLGIARGSLKELETQILIASDLDYLEKTAADACSALADEVGRMLSTLIAALRSRPK